MKKVSALIGVIVVFLIIGIVGNMDYETYELEEQVKEGAYVKEEIRIGIGSDIR